MQNFEIVVVDDPISCRSPRMICAAAIKQGSALLVVIFDIAGGVPARAGATPRTSPIVIAIAEILAPS